MCTTAEGSTEFGKMGERLENGIQHCQMQCPKNHKMT